MSGRSGTVAGCASAAGASGRQRLADAAARCAAAPHALRIGRAARVPRSIASSSTASTSRRTATRTRTSTSPPDGAVRPLAAAAVRRPGHARHQAAAAVLAGHRLDGPGTYWTLWTLRYPSVLYTLLTAAMVFLLARRFARSTSAGCLAALTYLAFFSTYHYGRPFLTNAPETFWLFLAWFIPLYWRTGDAALAPVAGAARRDHRRRAALQILRAAGAGGPGARLVVPASARLPLGRVRAPGCLEARAHRGRRAGAVLAVVRARSGSAIGMAVVRDQGECRQVRRRGRLVPRRDCSGAARACGPCCSVHR